MGFYCILTLCLVVVVVVMTQGEYELHIYIYYCFLVGQYYGNTIIAQDILVIFTYHQKNKAHTHLKRISHYLQR